MVSGATGHSTIDRHGAGILLLLDNSQAACLQCRRRRPWSLDGRYRWDTDFLPRWTNMIHNSLMGDDRWVYCTVGPCFWVIYCDGPATGWRSRFPACFLHWVLLPPANATLGGVLPPHVVLPYLLLPGRHGCTGAGPLSTRVLVPWGAYRRRTGGPIHRAAVGCRFSHHMNLGAIYTPPLLCRGLTLICSDGRYSDLQWCKVTLGQALKKNSGRPQWISPVIHGDI